jgi:putative Holliday junction resolvase
VDTIVIGLPLCLDGSVGASARRAKRFAEKLGGAIEIPIVLWDERMTTALADRALADAGVRAKNRKDKVDRVAAALILQSYLDAQAYQASRTEGDVEWRASERAGDPADEGADGDRSRAR